MALRAVGPEPKAVVLPFGDAYLLRLAREHRKLEHFATETIHQLDERRLRLVDGLASRNLTRIDLDGVSIRRVGRTGITVH